MWQATAAADPRVRRVMRGIARDETRHAALAWQVAAWAEPRLRARDRAAVRATRAAARDELRAELARARDAELIAVAGVPDARATGRLLAGLDARLWQAPPA